MNILFLRVSVVSDCVCVSAFASLVSVPVGIVRSAVGTKSCAITALIKMGKLNIKKKKKEHDEKVFLAKTSLNTTKVLISKAFIDSYITYDELVSVNNIFEEYNEMKEEIKNPENAAEYTI